MLPLCPGTMPGNGKGRVGVGSCERRQFPFLFCLVLPALHHHHDPGPDVDTAIKIGHVLVHHPDATRRHILANRIRLVGAVNAVER